MKRICLTESQARAFAAGATELRVPVKPQPYWIEAPVQEGNKWIGRYTDNANIVCPYLEVRCPHPVGSMVALTETYWEHKACTNTIIFEADTLPFQRERGRWLRDWYSRRPAITMPAEFSRFKRRVKAVRVEHGELWEWVLELEAPVADRAVER